MRTIRRRLPVLGNSVREAGVLQRARAREHVKFAANFVEVQNQIVSPSAPSQRSRGWLRALVHTCHDRQLERNKRQDCRIRRPSLSFGFQFLCSTFTCISSRWTAIKNGKHNECVLVAPVVLFSLRIDFGLSSSEFRTMSRIIKRRAMTGDRWAREHDLAALDKQTSLLTESASTQ